MNLVQQPKGSNLCGQACVAMLMDITLDEAIKLVGKKGKTNRRDLEKVLVSKYYLGKTIIISRSSKVNPDGFNYEVPGGLLIMKIKWHRGNGSHYIISNDHSIYDSDRPRPWRSDEWHKVLIDIIGTWGHLSSYIELTLKHEETEP